MATPWRSGVILAAALTLCCARSQPELQHACDSPEALAQAVLDALARNDRSSLEALALSEDEFHEVVWPELPAARRERNLPWDYVWAELRQKSGASLRGTLARHGGRQYHLIDVKSLGETSQYATFGVRRATQLAVRDADGQRHEIQIFGSMLMRRGRYKVFSYVVD